MSEFFRSQQRFKQRTAKQLQEELERLHRELNASDTEGKKLLITGEMQRVARSLCSRRGSYRRVGLRRA